MNPGFLLAEWLAKDRDLRRPAERYRIGLIESWSSIGVNLLLALLKMIFGLITNSIALIADAIHSASDVLSSLVVLIGFSLARRKPDREHPHGHGRIEYLAGLFIAIMLVGSGVYFIYGSYVRLIEGVYARPSMAALIAVIAAFIVKELMYSFSIRLSKLIDSEVLAGDAWHHRTDSLSSLLVIAAIAGSYLGMPALDAYFGFAIALIIIYAGIQLGRKSCSRLLGTAPPESLQNEVSAKALEVDGVVDAHDLEVHDYGSWKVMTIHIVVCNTLTLGEAHDIAHKVEDSLSSCFYCDAVVHLDPR